MKYSEINCLIIIFIMLNFCSNAATETQVENSVVTANNSEIKKQNLSGLMNEFKLLYQDDDLKSKDINKSQITNFISTNEKAFNFKKGKSKRKTKKETKKSQIKYSIKIIKNPLIDKKPPHNYKKCSVRTGILFFIHNRPVFPKYQIDLFPSYIMLTTDRLIISKDTNKINLILSISLNEIQRIDQHYINTFCFDIITNQIIKYTIKNGQATLCAKNEKEMFSWINSVLEFKKCTLKEIQKADHNSQLFVDFSKINEVTKIRSKKKLAKLFYNSSDKAITHSSDTHNKIKESLERLMTHANIGDIAVNQLRRQYLGRMMKARSLSHSITDRKFRLKNMAYDNNLREKEMESRIIHRRNRLRELHIISSTEHKMNEDTRTELKQYKKLYEEQIQRQRKKTQSQAARIVDIIGEQDKLTDYRICFDMGLLRFENKKLIGSICNQYYGKFGEDTCNLKENFCTMCCDFHIGVNHVERRLDCRRSCSKVINAKKKTNVNKLMKKLNNKMKKSKYSKRKTILKPKTSKIYISNPSIKMANVKKMFRNYNKKFNKKTI